MGGSMEFYEGFRGFKSPPLRQPVGHFCDSSSRAAVEARLETKNGQIFYRLLRRKPFENAAPARLRNVARLVGAMARLSVRI